MEYRVQEVLEEKLATILTDLGVDKISDVLDSSEVAADWENLYKEAVLKPEGQPAEQRRSQLHCVVAWKRHSWPVMC